MALMETVRYVLDDLSKMRNNLSPQEGIHHRRSGLK